MSSLEQRFWAKVHKTDTCWLWTGAKSRGYGQIGRGGKAIKTHRVSWELHNGPIPAGDDYHGMCVLHTCDIPACVNPDHLFLGTNADNVVDMIAKGRRASTSGEAHHNAKLAAEQVLEIRSRQRQTQQALAKEFDISREQIRDIRSGKSWAHL